MPARTQVSGPTVTLRVGQLRKFMEAGGIRTLAELGARIDTVQHRVIPPDPPTDSGHLSRLMSGESQPSARTIGALLRVFPFLDFSDLFEVTDR